MAQRRQSWSSMAYKHSTRPTVAQLESAGFCSLPIPPSGILTISRINCIGWLERLAAVGKPVIPDPPPDLLRALAHEYRKQMGMMIHHVPHEIWAALPRSDGRNAPSAFRYHWTYPEGSRKKLPPEDGNTIDNTIDQYPYEEPEMTLTQTAASNASTSTELTLEPVPMKTVVVTFPDTDDREFVFFAPAEARVGDHAVVYAKGLHATKGPFSIGKIERETPDLDGRAKTAILGTFNETFAKHVEARMQHLSEVRGRLQAKKRAFEERALFEVMAEKDPEVRELLDQLKQFNV